MALDAFREMHHDDFPLEYAASLWKESDIPECLIFSLSQPSRGLRAHAINTLKHAHLRHGMPPIIHPAYG